ncbi:N-acetylglucosamine-6-phosphate deacetylase [Cypionkella sp.]|uniref:N-acetylglucosamine-6-phosphate deacetylase n=1 Tax=Cypionkella sp. TaxID=2811411 RepID=UPI002AB7FD98|nr:N-acetylglucosamine-6-phosphate deacetylase [Cypionkella sp.]MDZ4393267.1 N-acetylglucosamine-6-phosphate deacetylase [Cypionkella sp.]
MTRLILTAPQVFDGTKMLPDHAVVIEAGEITALLPITEAPNGPRQALTSTLAPGLIDLQVNGGAGIMLDGTATPESIATICAAHARLGATGILPTLITDTPSATTAVIKAGIATAKAKTPGFLGLHLEGPHLDPKRQGAHDPALIRPMTDADLAELCAAASQLPALMLTLAPASVTLAQITQLTQAGAIVSLGHTEASYDQAIAATQAGAACVTHLFNAMSQLGNREPGLVGAVLSGSLHAGIIADGLHVHPATLRTALAARPEGLFLVSDAMAVAGTNLTEFTLGTRRILRQNGRLLLSDGTLAGADLSLPQAVAFLITQLGQAPARALAMASSIPARLIRANAGQLRPGTPADLVHFDANWQLGTVWQNGNRL